MNREAVAAELPAAVVDWLTTRGSDETWRSIAWDVAAAVARRVLINGGEGGWNGEVRRLLESDASPGVRAIAALLETGPRRRAWSARAVADLACARFDLANAGALRRALRPEVFVD